MICSDIIEPKSDYIDVENSFDTNTFVISILCEVSVVVKAIFSSYATRVCGGNLITIV